MNRIWFLIYEWTTLLDEINYYAIHDVEGEAWRASRDPAGLDNEKPCGRIYPRRNQDIDRIYWLLLCNGAIADPWCHRWLVL